LSGEGLATRFILEDQGHHIRLHLLHGGFGDQLENVLQAQALADGLGDLVQAQGLLEADVLLLQTLAIEAPLDDVDNLLDLERLEDVVVGTLLHGLDGGLDRAESGHDDGEHVEALLVDLLEQLQAAHSGHLQIADHQVVGPTL
jgi:hypothetical protein